MARVLSGDHDRADTQRKRRLSLRALWVQIHLWLGLTLGVIGAAIGITGSILLYGPAIDRALNPSRYAVTGAALALPYADYVKRAEQAVGNGARTLNLRFPDGAQPVLAFVRAKGDNGFRRVYLDPPTGKVLDASPNAGMVAWVHDFHENLKAREYNGRALVGAVGIAMLISSLSGIYLWWPRRRLQARDFAFRRGFTWSRNLHYMLGFYGFLVLGALSFSGMFLAFPDAGRSVVAAFSPLTPSPRGVQAKGSGGLPMDIEAAVELALGHYAEEATVTGIGLPAGPRGVYRVNLQLQENQHSVAAVVFIDPSTHSIVQATDPTTHSAGDAFLAFQRGLHDGSVFAPPLRPILFLGGLLPVTFVVTGSFIWLRSRRLRHAGTPSR